MKKKKKPRHYASQEKYAEAMNAARKDDSISRFYCPEGAAPQYERPIEWILRRRIDLLERELSVLAERLDEVCYKSSEQSVCCRCSLREPIRTRHQGNNTQMTAEPRHRWASGERGTCFRDFSKALSEI